jgi:hypothetical protein
MFICMWIFNFIFFRIQKIWFLKIRSTSAHVPNTLFGRRSPNGLIHGIEEENIKSRKGFRKWRPERGFFSSFRPDGKEFHEGATWLGWFVLRTHHFHAARYTRKHVLRSDKVPKHYCSLRARSFFQGTRNIMEGLRCFYSTLRWLMVSTKETNSEYITYGLVSRRENKHHYYPKFSLIII